jgi:hypothetical protein
MGVQRRETDVVFLSGKRTGFGTFGGSLKDCTATGCPFRVGRSVHRRRAGGCRSSGGVPGLSSDAWAAEQLSAMSPD